MYCFEEYIWCTTATIHSSKFRHNPQKISWYVGQLPRWVVEHTSVYHFYAKILFHTLKKKKQEWQSRWYICSFHPLYDRGFSGQGNNENVVCKNRGNSFVNFIVLIQLWYKNKQSKKAVWPMLNPSTRRTLACGFYLWSANIVLVSASDVTVNRPNHMTHLCITFDRDIRACKHIRQRVHDAKMS